MSGTPLHLDGPFYGSDTDCGSFDSPSSENAFSVNQRSSRVRPVFEAGKCTEVCTNRRGEGNGEMEGGNVLSKQMDPDDHPISKPDRTDGAKWQR